LDKNISDLKSVVQMEKTEMEAIENQIDMMKAKYELKKKQVALLNSQLEDKTKLVNDAKRAYSKVGIKLYT
jgi:hypothetical protein